MIKKIILTSSLFISCYTHAEYFKYNNINELKNSNLMIDMNSNNEEIFKPTTNNVNSKKIEKQKKRMIESNINGEVCLSISNYAYHSALNYYSTGISKPLFSRIIEASTYHDVNSYIQSVPVSIVSDLENEKESLKIFNQLKYKAGGTYLNNFKNEISLLFTYKVLYNCLIKDFPYYQYEDIDYFNSLKALELNASEVGI